MSLTSSELVPSCRLEIDVHRVMVIRMKQGADYIYLETNMPDPMGMGSLALGFQVPRDTGEAFCRSQFPGVEMVIYHYGLNRSHGMDERTARSMSQAHEKLGPALERRVV